MSLAVQLAQHDDVTVLDIDPDRVAKINAGETTVADLEITAYLLEKELNLSATGYEINTKPPTMKVELCAD